MAKWLKFLRLHLGGPGSRAQIDQEHQNDDEQRDTEAGGMPGLGVERQHTVPQSHGATRLSGARGWAGKRESWVCSNRESACLASKPG